MTGQVKEEVLTRFGELGVRVSNGTVYFEPTLLRACEFVNEARSFRYLDVADTWQELTVPAKGLAFTWCQLPIVYVLGETTMLEIEWADGRQQTLADPVLSAEISDAIFTRNGGVKQLTLTLTPQMLFAG